MSDASARTGRHVTERRPEPLADHVNAGLSIGVAVALFLTDLTDNLVLALVTLVLLATLTSLATFTAIAGRSAAAPAKALAGAVAVAATALVLLRAETPWGLAVPTIALAVGVPRARTRRPRLLALAVSAATTAAVLLLQ